MGAIGQENPGELRINLRLQKADQEALGRLLKACWPGAKSRARAIRTAIAEYPQAMRKADQLQERVDWLQALLTGLLDAEGAMTSAKEAKQSSLDEIRRALGKCPAQLKVIALGEGNTYILEGE